MDPCGLLGNPRGPLSAHAFRVRGAAGSWRSAAARLLPLLVAFRYVEPLAHPPAARSALGSGWPGRFARNQTRKHCGSRAGAASTKEDSSCPAHLPSANRGARAVRFAFSSVYLALIPQEGEGHASPWRRPELIEELNQGVGWRTLCPTARRPAKLICRRLLAQLANLSSPLLTLPG